MVQGSPFEGDFYDTQFGFILCFFNIWTQIYDVF